MGKKTAIGTALLLASVCVSFFLYSYLVGFERESLARKLPADTYASISIRHIRKLGIAFATDEHLQASAKVVQAIGKILEASLPSFDLKGEKPEIDETLLLSLSQHFKTQLTLAAIPHPDSSKAAIDFALVSDFYGQANEFAETLDEIARQASASTGIAINWQSGRWREIPYWTLAVPLSELDTELPPLKLAWAVYDETLYVCTSAESLEKLLDHALSETSKSVLDQLSRHDLSKHASAADLTIYLNPPPLLNRFASDLKADLLANGGFAANFSPETLIEELKLKQIDSFVAAIEFTGDRSSYSGITYSGTIPLIANLSDKTQTYFPEPQQTSIYAYESLGLDAGKSALILKNALLKAAPLANFPYFGIRSKIRMDSGLDLEEALSTAFAPGVEVLQAFDFGTGRNQYGEIQEQVVLDAAFRFKLNGGSKLEAIIESQIPSLLELSSIRAYKEGDVVYIDRDWDTTVTANRFAFSFDENHLVLGSGTLKSFQTLMAGATEENAPASANAALSTVGHGSLAANNLPTTLFQLAAVLYQQVNNTPNIPSAFLDFDWASLTVLEQNRFSTTYQSEGKLFRVSKQLDN